MSTPTNSTSNESLIVLKPGEGEPFDVAGAHLTWKAKGKQSDYAFSLCEQRLEQDEMVPLHSHPYSEVFYVLEGVVSFYDGTTGADGWTECVAGSTVIIPANAVHGFRNASPAQVRVLGISTYLHQLFFDAVRDAARNGEFAQRQPAEAMQLVGQIGAAHKMTFLPPA